MNAERQTKIEEIYHASLDISAESRSEFLAAACGTDEELQNEIRSLLCFAEVTSSLIDKPPLDIAAEIFSGRIQAEIVGTNIKHYKILAQIGTGGMGDVYLAEDTRLERRVAIKFIKTEFSENPTQLRRFIREAKTASSLNHPNIITVYEIGKTKNSQFIATEFIEGKTLRRAINEGSLNLGEILDIAVQVANALHAAHSAGVIHRDIKPENIMLREDKLVKVLDFGLVKLVGKRYRKDKIPVPLPVNQEPSQILANNLTAPDLLMGTVAYISPEQARLAPIDARSDVWSLTIVLYEMASGCQPFKGKTARATIDSILNDEPAALADYIPSELQRILRKGLQKNAEDRYQTAPELLGDLKLCQKNFADEAEFERDAAAAVSHGKTSQDKTIVSSPLRARTDAVLQSGSNNPSAPNSFSDRSGKTNFSQPRFW